MGKISFSDFQQVSKNESTYDNDGVSFFALKQDGEEAIVRIMHDSTDDFDIVAVHPFKLGERYAKVACLRDANAPVDHCPMCKAGTKLQYRFYIRMIQYVQNEQGKIIGTPVVWDRAAKGMAQEIADKINEYGPLSECIFKIKRNGKPGDLNTTYSINFANPMVFKPEMYPKNTEVFKNYSVLGRQVYNKSFEDMQHFLATGKFPETANNTTNNVNVEHTQTQVPQQMPEPPQVQNDPSVVTQQPYIQQPYAQPAPQPQTNMPWAQQSDAPMQRPNRQVYY